MKLIREYRQTINHWGAIIVTPVIEIHNNGYHQLFCTDKELLMISSLLNNPKKKSAKYHVTQQSNGSFRIDKKRSGVDYAWVDNLTDHDINVLKTIKNDRHITIALQYYSSQINKAGI